MVLADNKYKSLTKSGAWMQKFWAQKWMVALAALVQTLERVVVIPRNQSPRSPGMATRPKFPKKERARPTVARTRVGCG